MDYEIRNAAEWDLPRQSPEKHVLQKYSHSEDDKGSDDSSAEVHSTVESSSYAPQRGITKRRNQYSDHRATRPELSVVDSETIDKRSAIGKSPVRRIAKPLQLPNKVVSKKPHENFWPKVRPENDYYGLEAEKARKQNQKTIHDERRRQEDEDGLFVYQGVYILSQDDIDPDEVQEIIDRMGPSLGSKIEYDRLQAIITISAQDYEVVKKSLLALRARIISSSLQEHGLILIIEPPVDNFGFGKSLVQMVDAQSNAALPKAAGLADNRGARPLGMCEMVPHVSLQSKPLIDNGDEARLLRRNELALRTSIQMSLARLQNRRGTIQMRLAFGALVFHRYPWPTGAEHQTIETFVQRIRHPRTRASLYRLSPANDLYGHVTRITSFFVPYAPEHKTLAETGPFFVGRFIWPSHPGRKFHVAFEATTEAIHCNGRTKPRVLDRKWLRLGYKGYHRELDAMVTQLNGGLSCSFQVEFESVPDDTWTPPSLLPASQIPFAFQEDDHVETASKGLLAFDPRASHCRAYKQRAVWRFRLKMNTTFVFELARHDSYENWEKQEPAESLDRKPSETRWDARVYSESWPGALAKYQNQGPDIVDSKSGPSLDAFFPECNYKPGGKDGFEEFIYCIRNMLSLLNHKEQTKLHQQVQ